MPSRRDWSTDRGSLLAVVIDDDESVREGLFDLLKEFGFAARAFALAEQFLASDCIDQTDCLILDVGMPRMTGPELYRELRHRGQTMPTIFITGQTDETIRTRILKLGAAGLLFKPFHDKDLLAAIKAALHAT